MRGNCSGSSIIQLLAGFVGIYFREFRTFAKFAKIKCTQKFRVLQYLNVTIAFAIRVLQVKSFIGTELLAHLYASENQVCASSLLASSSPIVGHRFH